MSAGNGSGDGELRAFDNILCETNDTTRQILSSQYSYKRKKEITEELKSETERMKIQNARTTKDIKTLNDTIKSTEIYIKSLHESAKEFQRSNSEVKTRLESEVQKRQKLAQRFRETHERYQKKWLQYKQVYESSPYALQLAAIEKDLRLKAFIIENYKHDERNLSKAYQEWVNINKKRDQAVVIEFAKFMVARPKKLQILHETRAEIARLNKEITEVSMKNNITKREESRKQQTVNAAVTVEVRGGRVPEDDLPSLTQYFDISQSDINVNLPLIPNLNQISKTKSLSDEGKRLSASKENKPNNFPKYYQNQYYAQNAFRYKPFTNDFITQTHNMINYPLNSIELDQPEGIDNTNNNASNTEEPITSKQIVVLEEVAIEPMEANTFIQSVKFGDTLLVDRIGSDVPTIKTNAAETPVEINHTTDEDDNTRQELPRSDSELPMTPLLPPTQYKDVAAQLLEIEPKARDDTTGSFNVSPSFARTPDTRITDEELKASVTNKRALGSGDGSPSCVDDASQGNLDGNSQANNNNYNEYKEHLLKKYKLDSSPTFVYSKNDLVKSAEKNVTSKFFSNMEPPECQGAAEEAADKATAEPEPEHGTVLSSDNHRLEPADREETEQPNNSDSQITEPSSLHPGLSMFGSGALANLSIMSCDSDYEDSTYDFTNMLESPALLSPKADEPVAASVEPSKDTGQSTSLFGFNRTPFNLFGGAGSRSGEAKPDASAQNTESGFSFNVQEKKKSGFFRLFN